MICTFVDLFAVSKDVVLTAVAMIGAFCAIKGLSTWNRQIKGTAEYELARRLLRCAYRLREAIKSVRNPLMLVEEMPSPPNDDAPFMGNEYRRFYGLSKGYQNRWDKVVEVESELRAELVEAEVLWGMGFGS